MWTTGLGADLRSSGRQHRGYLHTMGCPWQCCASCSAAGYCGPL